MFGFARQRVYLHLFLALACGCALGYHYPLPVELLTGDWLLIACILTLLTALWVDFRRRQDVLAALPGFLLLACIGTLATSVAIALPQTATLNDHVSSEPVVIEGTVASIPKFQRGHLRFMLDAATVEVPGGDPVAVSGRCYAYLKADSPPELYFTENIRLHTNLREIEPPLNRGQFDYRRYLMLRGTVLTAYSASERQLTRLDAAPPTVWKGLTRLRGWLTDSLQRGLPEDLGELTVSVVYGDKITDLDDSTSERFRRAGLTHILVASGTQISLLIVLLAMLCWRITDDFSWRGWLLNSGHFVVTLAVVCAYAAITGFETSIVRALAMGALVMAGRLLHRQADGLTALAQSGIVLLLINPLALMSPGFQLSFGATFGLIYTAGVAFPLIAHLTGWRRWVAQTLITTGGAQLFVAPVLAAHFQQLSVWGLFSNMLAIPLAFCLLITGGLLSIGVSYIPLLGDLVRWLTFAEAWCLDRTAWLFAALPGSNIAVPHPPLWWLLAFYLAVFIIGEWVKHRADLKPPAIRTLRLAVPAALLLLFAGVLWWLAVPSPELSALDLKRCQAWIWRPYTGRTVLITQRQGLHRSHNADTIASALRYRGINRLDAIVLTDIDADAVDEGSGLISDIPDYAAPLLTPGAPVEDVLDLGWLPAGKTPPGARLALGDREIWVVWDSTANLAQSCRVFRRNAAVEHGSPADLLVLNTSIAAKVAFNTSVGLDKVAHRVVAVGSAGNVPGSIGLVSGEFSIRPQPAAW